MWVQKQSGLMVFIEIYGKNMGLVENYITWLSDTKVVSALPW